MTTLRTIAALVLSATLLAPAAARGDAGETDAAVRAALTRHGFEAVAPTPAAEVELPDLQGDTRTLADWAGRWVLLTFFASWCGPCRSELPSLQALHAEWHDDGLAVVGVGLDASTDSLRRLVESKGVTFPVLLDPKGRVGRRYRASAIPIAYWIDPLGRVVGVARGAREWDASGELIRELLAAIPAGDAPPEGYETAPAFMPTPEVVALPDHVVPPTASVRTSAGELLPGDTFTVDVAVRWAGHTGDYVLHTPELELPGGIAGTGTSASSSSLDDEQTVTYQIGLRAEAPGEYALDPVDVQYTPRGGHQPIHSRVEGVTVTVRKPTPWGLIGGLGGGVVLVGVGVAVVLVRRRSR